MQDFERRWPRRFASVHPLCSSARLAQVDAQSRIADADGIAVFDGRRADRGLIHQGPVCASEIDDATAVLVVEEHRMGP